MLLNCPKPFGNCSDILASDFSNPCSNTAAAAFVFGRRFVAFDVARRLLHEEIHGRRAPPLCILTVRGVEVPR